LRMKLENAEQGREQAEDQQKKLRSALDSLIQNQQSGQSEVQGLQEEIDRLSERLLAQEAQQVALAEARDEAERQVDLLKKALKRERALRMEREAVAKDLREIQEGRTGEVSELNLLVSELQADNRELKSQLDMLREALQASQLEKAELSAQFDQLRRAQAEQRT